jgi:hypothetical protein
LFVLTAVDLETLDTITVDNAGRVGLLLTFIIAGHSAEHRMAIL